VLASFSVAFIGMNNEHSSTLNDFPIVLVTDDSGLENKEPCENRADQKRSLEASIGFGSEWVETRNIMINQNSRSPIWMP
jgi:hypothetical protein